MNVEKLRKMAGSVRTGGKGTMRRSVYFSVAAVTSQLHHMGTGSVLY